MPRCSIPCGSTCPRNTWTISTPGTSRITCRCCWNAPSGGRCGASMSRTASRAATTGWRCTTWTTSARWSRRPARRPAPRPGASASPLSPGSRGHTTCSTATRPGNCRRCNRRHDPMDLKISPRSVQQETVRLVREAITSGYFKPGERLVEAKLCSLLGVSRTSVREALRVLATEKLITIVPNKGPSVAELSWEEAENIYHLRALLEGEAAALAAGRVKQDDLRRMREALDIFAAAVDQQDWKTRISATADFYEVIIQCCGNAVMGEVLHGLLTRINFLRARTMASPGRAKHSVRELEAIYGALEKGDAREARAVAVAHVKAAETEARDVYREMNHAA
ncbi:hypothetical protein CDO46_02960 [Pigmentiphaga sp. NML030171]|nr:hypothetical protein CDO46_02960 [Pigmentiphaga sp. NML030171]